MLDLGSGGGVPGLVVALALPALDVVLLDAQLRRTAFLESAVEELRLDARVRVVRGRAEKVGREPVWRATQDAVTSRGFGPPAVTAECAAPFLVVGGRLVVSEPPTEEDRWPPAVEQLGLAVEGVAASDVRLMVLRQVAACPERFPRRAPAKRPLF